MATKDKQGNLHSDKNGQFVSKGAADVARKYEKYTPSEEPSVRTKVLDNEPRIDFSRDNYLPELKNKDFEKTGASKNKRVLLKKSIIDLNFNKHADLTQEDFEKIVVKALYSPSEVFSANKNKPYFHFAKIMETNEKGDPRYGVVLIDVEERKDNFEVVHVHYVGIDGLQRYKNKTK